MAKKVFNASGLIVRPTIPPQDLPYHEYVFNVHVTLDAIPCTRPIPHNMFTFLEVL